MHDPRDFERVYAARKAVHAPHVVLFFCPNGLSIARLGVSVGAKHGNAVRRNRIKRVFRAAFRQCRHLLPPGHDYVLVPKKGVAEYSSAMVRAAIERIARNPRSGLPRPAGGGPEHSGHGNDAVAPAAERR
ncbi:MAG: ribonuclease P protein component [Planctomycetota bacterium]|nr:ribonuclease P protein component [Planctomycetota bacterium]